MPQEASLGFILHYQAFFTEGLVARSCFFRPQVPYLFQTVVGGVSFLNSRPLTGNLKPSTCHKAGLISNQERTQEEAEVLAFRQALPGSAGCLGPAQPPGPLAQRSSVLEPRDRWLPSLFPSPNVATKLLPRGTDHLW